MHKYVKTITVQDETYQALLTLKEDRDSISDVIDRLVTKRIGSIRQFAGGLRDSKNLDKRRVATEEIQRSGRARV